METALFHGSSFWNLDSFSGFRALNWRGNIRGKFTGVTGGSFTPSSAEDGSIYVDSDDGHLYALSPNGQRK